MSYLVCLGTKSRSASSFIMRVNSTLQPRAAQYVRRSHSFRPSTADLDCEPGIRIPVTQPLFLVGAQGRTGNIFVTTSTQWFLKSRGKRALTVAPSAVASQLLDNGRIAHSPLKISISVHSERTCSINAISQLAEPLNQTALILWDEIDMSHRHNLDAIDRNPCNLCRSTFPFGGNPVFNICDFRQILPVVRAANQCQIDSACFRRYRIFPLFISLQLHMNMQLSTFQKAPRNSGSTHVSILYAFFWIKKTSTQREG